MNGHPGVSIILPTYNRAKLLPRAINSVLIQQYDNWELIVIDDGSTDKTSQFISRYDDQRIKYVRFETNRGIGYGRHEGICRARGAFIAFIDSDDAWLPGKLSSQFNILNENPQIDLIFGNYININHVTDIEELGFNQTRHSLDMLEVKTLAPGVMEVISGIPEALLVTNFFATPTVMLRASLPDRVGNFNTSLSGPEDFEFWWRAAVKGGRYAYIDRPLIERHKDEESITSQRVKFLPRYLIALDMCVTTAQEIGRHDLIPLIRQAKHRAYTSLIHTYALLGQRKNAFHTFAQSLRYGISRWALAYFGAALAGPKAITSLKQLRNNLK